MSCEDSKKEDLTDTINSEMHHNAMTAVGGNADLETPAKEVQEKLMNVLNNI